MNFDTKKPELVSGFCITMKIGIDCRILGDHKSGKTSGIGEYVFFLVQSLLERDQKNEYVLFFSRHQIIPFRGDFTRAIFDAPKIPVVNSHILFFFFLIKYYCDLYHFPNGHIPIFFFGNAMITLHDIAMLKHPEWFPDGQLLVRKILLPFSVFKAKKILCVSKKTFEEAKSFFPNLKKKARVVHLGHGMVSPKSFSNGSSSEMLNKRGLRKANYVLFVGTLEPRKNLMAAMRAYEKSGITIPFVIAGNRGWKCDDIISLLMPAAGCKPTNLRYLGPISNDEKRVLMENCEIFFWPSLYEGFGIPVLEAMACGAAVITSQETAMEEFAFDAAKFVDPQNENEMADALLQLHRDVRERSELQKKARLRALDFSSEKCAKETLEAYRDVR